MGTDEVMGCIVGGEGRGQQNDVGFTRSGEHFLVRIDIIEEEGDNAAGTGANNKVSKSVPRRGAGAV